MPARRIALSLSLVLLGACAGSGGRVAPPATAPQSLAAYRDEAELGQALARWRSQAEALRPAPRAGATGTAAPVPMPAPTAAAPAAPAAAAERAGGDGITNVQTAGVDEGGIVKRAGDHLVILRRGRLFTVRVGDDALAPVAVLPAYAPSADPRGAWYDELLVAGNTVVVVGYSYARGGTEIGLFELGPGGTLAYRATYHLRSFDYYSSRNYASRLIGRSLVFYSATLLQPGGPPPEQRWPGLRRWQGQATPPDFERILPATQVYRTDDEFDPGLPLALHTVTRCELGDGAMQCRSTAVLGPTGRVFYVAAQAVYVWTTPSGRRLGPPMARPEPGSAARPLSAVFRLPLDGTAPSGLKTAGVPIDQLSFLEDASGHLNVLLRESGPGEGLWGDERSQGRLALLRVPLAAFGDGRTAAQRTHYRLLPGPTGGLVHNRFIGDWLLWGGRAAPRLAPDVAPQAAPGAWALRYATADAPQALAPAHGVERIEALGTQAVLVGNAGTDLHFSAVRLAGTRAALAGGHVQPGARQGETRSHGFFYRPQGDDQGLLGLPVRGPGARGLPGVQAGAQGSAAVLFLRQRALDFHPLGALAAQQATPDDGCRASCVDWYGNARPLFMGERVLALMGYELVEGRLDGRGRDEHIVERRRISFLPDAAAREGRYAPFN